jgi:hypothetical protein
MKSKRSINKKDGYAPGLPAEEIKKLREELSDPNLIPQPYLFDRTGELTDKMKEVFNQLVAEYNRKVVKVIEEEKKVAFEAGRQEERRGLTEGQGRKYAKK